jgi:phosphate:Na+ symporter
MPLIYIWEVLGGLGLFVLGMKSMSEGLQKLAGEKLRRSLEKVTGNRLTAALMGSCLASLLQSGSAASILVIGFVNAGLVSMYQALAVLLGTGIGSTLAIQFIAFNVSSLALPAVFTGVLLTFFSKRRRVVYLGNLLLGAGLVFLGLQIMEAGFSPISRNDLLKGLQNNFFSWRISAALLGAFLTIVIQSGSAATGIVIAMAGSGVVGIDAGVAMVVGEVLGTALVTAAASVNGSLAAKRTALVYLIISIASVSGVLLLFPFFLKLVDILSPEMSLRAISSSPYVPTVDAASALLPDVARHLANAHTIFNVLNAVLFLPFIGILARSAPVLMPGSKRVNENELRPLFIDVRIINTPTIAFLQAKNELKRMVDVTRMMFDEVIEQFYKYDAKKFVRIGQRQEVLTVLQREISAYLITLSRQTLNRQTTMEIPVILHMLNDLKHIGDQNEAILELLRRKKEDKIIFTAAAMTELRDLAALVGEMVHLATGSVSEETSGTSDLLADRRNAVMAMQETMLNSHMKRLTGGKCTVVAGMSYSDIISAFVKLSDHAFTLMEMKGELKDVLSDSGN